VLLVLDPALGLLFRRVVRTARVIILSVLIAHTAWHWMIERGGELAKFPLPSLYAAFIASAHARNDGRAVLVAGVWLVSGLLRRWLGTEHRHAGCGCGAEKSMKAAWYDEQGERPQVFKVGELPGP